MTTSLPGPALAGVLSPLGREECLSLLAPRPVGRVVFTHRALPVVLPVNFLLHDTGVLMRVGPGSVLAGVSRGAVVAFQVDDVDAGPDTGWSVTVVGRADEVGDEEIRQRALTALAPWTDGDLDHVVRIGLEQVTGRRLSRPGRVP